MDITLDEIKRRERAIRDVAETEAQLSRMLRTTQSGDMWDRIAETKNKITAQLDAAEAELRQLRVTYNANLDRERNRIEQAKKRPVKFLEIQEVATV